MAKCMRKLPPVGKRVEPVVDFDERRATRGVAGFGAIVRSGGSRPSACRPVVAGGLDQRADRRGVLRGHGQRAALAVDFWPQGGRGITRPQGAGSHGGQGAGGVIGARTGPGARDRGSGELDLATPVVLVLDNGPIHTSKASRAALAARPWLTVEWLPKYAPELNDIERSWRDLKCHFLAHQTFSDPDHLDRAIHKAIADMNRERQTRVCTNLQIAA